jgi:hypothetical protein
MVGVGRQVGEEVRKERTENTSVRLVPGFGCIQRYRHSQNSALSQCFASWLIETLSALWIRRVCYSAYCILSLDCFKV